VFGWALAGLVQAGARSGARDVAAIALKRLVELTRASGTDSALGIQARSRALLSDSQSAGSLYREAIERLARSRISVHLPRAHLLYGSGCAAKTGVLTPASSCAPHTRCSLRWAPRVRRAHCPRVACHR
jgi:hypothetical protein